MVICDLKGSFVEAEKRATVLKADHGALKSDYDWFLWEHKGTKYYLAKKTKKVVIARNEAASQAKNFTKAMKLFGFSYRI